ncbi:hypothetical protein [Microcoleus sp. EPA2]|jgi:ubiquinone biosynthesis protein Coq4|uniref:hypothetical protein n=1 Tax=Microcoleus sp. EPA2 TaxID=2841654 RepID=UPI00312B435C
MADSELEVILKMAENFNPKIKSSLKCEIDLETWRQLPAGTLGCEVVQFLNEQGWEPIASADWIPGKD